MCTRSFRRFVLPALAERLAHYCRRRTEYYDDQVENDPRPTQTVSFATDENVDIFFVQKKGGWLRMVLELAPWWPETTPENSRRNSRKSIRKN